MNYSEKKEYTYTKDHFRGLLRLLNAELHSESYHDTIRLTLSFRTLNSWDGQPIRFSLSRCYSHETPKNWNIADIIEYAMLHEVHEAAPQLFSVPDHRPGVLDDPETARKCAQASVLRFGRDLSSGRWDGILAELKPAWQDI